MKKNEKGVTLIEVIIAVALLGVIVVAFFGALSTASKALFIADERATAESLARTEMEYVNNQDYVTDTWSYQLPSTPPSWDASHTLPAGYDGYTADASATLLHATDDGIKKITITIHHHTKEIITLEDYKVDR